MTSNILRGAISRALLAAALLGFGAAPVAAQVALLTGPVDTVLKATSTDIGASVTANTAVTLAAANPARRGFTLENQTSGACYLSGLAAATADFHSLLIPAGTLYESRDSHVGTGALSVICAQAGGVYGRQW